MLGISNFFARWKNHELEEVVFYAAIIDSIKEVIKYELSPSLISYSDTIVTLKISPAAKNMIMIKKNDILAKIREKTNRKVSDIK